MKAPIPDPFEPPPQTEKLPRPRSLVLVIGVSLLFSCFSLLLRDQAASASHTPLAILWFASAFTWVIPLFLWLGYDWARIVKMILSFLALFLVFRLSHQHSLPRLDYIGRILFALIWLWYLTRPQVVGFFKGRPIQDSPAL